MISYSENWMRAVEFRRPEWIPIWADFAPVAWRTHRERLEEIVLRHPMIFRGYRAGWRDFDAAYDVGNRQGELYRDNWGCVWDNIHGGIEGQVVGHPLADWDALKDYQPPDPRKFSERGTVDWAKITAQFAEAKAIGENCWGNGERLFDRLYFLRGFENLMMDIATDDPHLPRLIEMLTAHELQLIDLNLAAGANIISFHTDIGTQNALMISPAQFRRHIKPMFKTLFQRCRQGGAHVALSSDGCLLEIVNDLIECGISTHDPQLRANTIDGIARAYKGKVCANVDLDRQMFPFCKPDDIRRQVEEVVRKVGSPDGGLMLCGLVWDEITPLANIEALCAALEEFRLYYA